MSNFVEQAEISIKKVLEDKDGRNLTTSKIRNILSMTARLYDRAHTTEFASLENDIASLKIQLIYQSGRDNTVKKLVETAGLVTKLGNITDNGSLIDYCQYVEALVAYFKYHGGKD